MQNISFVETLDFLRDGKKRLWRKNFAIFKAEMDYESTTIVLKRLTTRPSSPHSHAL